MDQMVLNILVAFLSALTATWLIIIGSKYGGTRFLDDTEGVQKFHKIPVPRIGGLGFLIGLAIGGIYFGLKDDNVLVLAKWAGIAVLPVFLGGLFEDIYNNVTPRDRLLLAFISAAVAYYELDAGLQSIGILWFDENIMVFPGVSLVITMLVVGGISQAANIMDGFNGLLIGFSMLALGAFSHAAHAAGNDWLVLYMSIMVGSLLGVFVFNFPKGHIFMGDSGAYLVGFLLAIFGLLLIRNEQISPWFPLLVLSYPVYETLFSIYRKKVMRGSRAMVPDRLHLHMLIYYRVAPKVQKLIRLNRNATSGLIMWIVGGVPMIPAILFWENTAVLIVAAILFGVCYVALYFTIVRFRLTGLFGRKPSI